jgi:death-on-curing protein
MGEVEHLTASDMVALAELFFQTLGYARPILRADGLGLLESAIYRARTMAYYGGADVVLQAAALCHGIVTNHAFVDGNKRAAWIATVTFLSTNGHDLPDDSDVAFADHILALYEQEDHSKIVEQLADWLRAHLLNA